MTRPRILIILLLTAITSATAVRCRASGSDEVVFNLRTRGLCALNDGEEIAVNNSNDFNDQYDVLTAEGFIRRGYVSTCRPAWDAIPPAGDE